MEEPRRNNPETTPAPGGATLGRAMAGNPDWLEGFEREVDDALRSRQSKRPPDAAAQRAAADFDLWWSSLGGDDKAAARDFERLRGELELNREECKALAAELTALKAAPGAPKA
ncbi:MAG TPA: hypothetical protein VNI01_03975, partial [Elusimicrobiota bacterium]|nr:hypothetical protein [Elusimicrobiota bacterium]